MKLSVKELVEIQIHLAPSLKFPSFSLRYTQFYVSENTQLRGHLPFPSLCPQHGGFTLYLCSHTHLLSALSSHIPHWVVTVDSPAFSTQHQMILLIHLCTQAVRLWWEKERRIEVMTNTTRIMYLPTVWGRPPPGSYRRVIWIMVSWRWAWHHFWQVVDFK